jgi:TonB family protein
MKKIILLLLSAASICFSQTDSIRTFYDNGKVKSEIHYLDSVRNGDARFYYENGNLKERMNYDNGKVNGLVEQYKKDGKLQETFNVEEGVRQGPASLYDSNGVYIADVNYDNGKKVVKPLESYNSEDVIAKEKAQRREKLWQEYYMKLYQIGWPEAVITDFYKDDPAYFLTAEKMPEPIGGMEAIEKEANNPAQTGNSKAEGVVKVLAYINRNGNVINADVVQSLNKSADEEAKNLIMNTKFSPGVINNDTVNVQMIVPVSFGQAQTSTPPKAD